MAGNLRHLFGESDLANDDLRRGKIGDRSLHFGVKLRLNGMSINLYDKHAVGRPLCKKAPYFSTSLLLDGLPGDCGALRP